MRVGEPERQQQAKSPKPLPKSAAVDVRAAAAEGGGAVDTVGRSALAVQVEGGWFQIYQPGVPAIVTPTTSITH